MAEQNKKDKEQSEEITEEKVSEDVKETKEDKKSAKKIARELEEAQKALEEKETELKEANTKYLTMLAEYDNFRRRSAKEKESTYADAYIDVLSQILPVIDNLERAAAYSSDNPENVAKGLDMTLRSFTETLEKLGVKEIEALGKEFDPNLHNAVMHTEDESLGEQEICEVLQKGYTMGDKVLRYAMVKVAN